ncbi:proton-conducting transporter transmembrane domain-containing protein, partial [Grimontia celer]|uniref:proton-conducting transporter transmembrane domain-containing protein n=1 Tax=Grimontia celer TaxID=1796497 RepID=UPI000B08C339
FISAFSLAGFPPLSGFWGKFIVIKASLQTSDYLLAATALLVGLLTIFSMSKIWNEAFWKKPTNDELESKALSRAPLYLYSLPIVMLAALSLLIGLVAEPFYQFAEHAAQQLLVPDAYIQAVLGGAP